MKLALGVSLGVALGALGALLSLHAAGPLPCAHAQAGPAGGAGAGGGDIVLGTGGITPNQNDICWMAFKDKGFKGEERTVLCLYKATGSGKSACFDLADVREVTYDCKAVQLATGDHDRKIAPQEMRNAFEKAKKEFEKAEKERKAAEEKK
jgi:hypothetical protein